MRRRIFAHIQLLWLFARRCLAYNLALSLLGGSALFAVSLATANPDLSLSASAVRAGRIAAIMGAVLVMTGGQALAIVAMRLFHGRELPYFRNAGLGEGILALSSWILALLLGLILLAASVTWIG